jgi:hypothetical protein
MARWNRVNAYRRFKGIYRLHVQELMSSRRKRSLEDEDDTLRINTPLLGVTTQNTRILKRILFSSPPAVITFQCSKNRIVGLLLLLLFERLQCKNISYCLNMRAYQSLTFCSETIRHTTGNCNLSLSLRSVGATKSFLALLIPTLGHSFTAAVLLFFFQSFSRKRAVIMMISVKCRLK